MTRSRSGTSESASADGVAAEVTRRYTASASASDATKPSLAEEAGKASGAADGSGGWFLRDLLEMYWKSRGAGLGGISREAGGALGGFGIVGAERSHGVTGKGNRVWCPWTTAGVEDRVCCPWATAGIEDQLSSLTLGLIHSVLGPLMSLMGEVTGAKRASSPRLLRQFGCDSASPPRRHDFQSSSFEFDTKNEE
jgi:hypothetical protein